MDSNIPLGQKNNLAWYMILSGVDNRPPMLDKDLYDSWKSQMELYMQNREYVRMILESVENGPLIWPTVEENGVIRTKKYVELSAAEKIQADCDMKATNIILQGLPADIYSLERKCKLYDAFHKSTHIKRETLHNLPPEWSKIVTDVKLVKDIHIMNFDQLHVYLEQHELHANEVRLLHESNQDPLAFVGSIYPNQHYSSTYPSQPQFNHSSIPSSYPYQSQMNNQTSYVPQIAYQSPQLTTQLMTESPLLDSSFDVHVFSPGDDLMACLNKAMAFLTVVASSRGDKVKVIRVSGIRVMLLVLGEAMQVDKQGLLNATTVKTEDLDTYDSDCDDLSNAQAVLMANISNYGSDVISEVPHSKTYLNDMENQSVHAMQDFEQPPAVDFIDNKIHKQMSKQMLNHVNNWKKDNKEQNNESITAKLGRYKERVKTFEQRLNIDLSSHEKTIDSQMDDMIKEKLALKEQVDSLEQNLSKQIKEKECLLQTFTVFKNESKEKEDKYMENKIDLEKKIKELDNILFKINNVDSSSDMNDEETLILEEKSRSKMSEKAKDLEIINKNISHKSIDYEKLNRLFEDFGKCFTSQQEMDAEQVIWLRIFNPTSKPSDASPVKIEALT
ncbi:hypothetical protein Tco_1088194 [Tanacetum coccineum]